MKPDYLTGEASEFWDRHYDRLTEARVLTEGDTDSFALLCEIWQHIRQTNPDSDSKQAVKYIALVKQYMALAKQFGLMPRERKKSGLFLMKELQDEFGI